MLNHTGEGDELGPTLSLRGLDNATYYRTVAGDRARYVNDTGCGNTLALDRPPVLRLALDALRHYAEAAGVDGFRFDLATTLGRARRDGFDPAAPLLQAIAQDPVLRDLKLDRRAVGHRARRPPARRLSRRLGRVERPLPRHGAPLLARRRRAGRASSRRASPAPPTSSRARSRPPSRSVNFVTAHDGFTLADLVAYERKHNEANGEDNRDGTDANFSWNHGVEGADRRCRDPRGARARRAHPARHAARCRAARRCSRWATSSGARSAATTTPTRRTTRSPGSTGTAPTATSSPSSPRSSTLRRRAPALRDDRWLTGEPADASGIPDVEWRHPDGRAMTRRGLGASRRPRARRGPLRARRRTTAGRSRRGRASTPGASRSRSRWPDARDGFAGGVRVDTALPTASRMPRRRRGRHAPWRRARWWSSSRKPGDGAARARQASSRPCSTASPRPPASRPTGRTCRDAPRVGDDTRRALLAAMGLRVGTTGRRASAWPRSPRARAPAPARGARRREDEPLVVRAGPAGARRRRDAAPRRRGRQRDALPFDADACAASAWPPPTGAPSRSGSCRCRRCLPGATAASRRRSADLRPAASSSRRRVLPAAGAARRRRRFGLAAHLYALRRRGRPGHRRLHRRSRELGAGHRARGRRTRRHQPAARALRRRARAREPLPSLGPALPRSDLHRRRRACPISRHRRDARALLARTAPRIARAVGARDVDYPGVWAAKRAVLEACFEALRARARPTIRWSPSSIASSPRGGEALRRFALFEAIAAAHPRRAVAALAATTCAGPTRPGVARVRRAPCARGPLRAVPAMARRPPARAPPRATRATAGSRSASIATSPSARRRTARRRGRSRPPSRAACRSARRPIRSAPTGQVWNLPPPIPEALAAAGYAGFRDLVAANMRHAGALRIDHVMGLVAAVLDSRRRDRGRRRLRRAIRSTTCSARSRSRARAPAASSSARISARCPRASASASRRPTSCPTACCGSSATAPRFGAPARYPAKAAACVSTHDLPTIAGWWNGADIDEKHALGLPGRRGSDRARRARRRERQALAEALDAGRRGRHAPGAAPERWPDRHRRRRTTPAVTAAIHRYACASPRRWCCFRPTTSPARPIGRQPARHRPRAAELAAEGQRRCRRAVADRRPPCGRSPISRPAGRAVDLPPNAQVPRRSARSAPRQCQRR